MGPPIYFGSSAASIPAVIVFWATFYGWIASEMWLGWKKRAPVGAAAQDRGSRWLVIGGVWASVALGLASRLRRLRRPSAGAVRSWWSPR